MFIILYACVHARLFVCIVYVLINLYFNFFCVIMKCIRNLHMCVHVSLSMHPDTKYMTACWCPG